MAGGFVFLAATNPRRFDRVDSRYLGARPILDLSYVATSLLTW
jgi:hypothetical protein